MATDESKRSVEVDGLTVTERYSRAFSAARGDAVRRRVRRQVFGDNYPEEADPHSFVTLSDLQRIALELRVGESGGITAPQGADHRQLLEAAGFAVVAYEATPRGEQLERALYQALLAAEEELIDEMGEAAGRPVINEARNRLPVLDRRCRI